MSTITLQNGVDSYNGQRDCIIRSWSTNWHVETAGLNIRTSSHILFTFDISALSGSNVTVATFSLNNYEQYVAQDIYCGYANDPDETGSPSYYGSAIDTFNAYADYLYKNDSTNQDWSSAAGNNFDDVKSGTIDTQTSASGWIDFDVTTEVSQAIAAGWTSITFYINGGGVQESICKVRGYLDSSNKPKLYAEYSAIGTEVYTRGNYASLPTDDSDLEDAFSDQDYIDVASDDSVRVSQFAVGEFAIFKFKDQNASQTEFVITWNGQSSTAPSSSTVYLQIYNRTTATWTTFDSESSEAANTDFNLTANITSSLSDYYDANYWISCRVYQEDI